MARPSHIQAFPESAFRAIRARAMLRHQSRTGSLVSWVTVSESSANGSLGT